jgi:predicted DNA-binding transcriptional regulator AlpA
MKTQNENEPRRLLRPGEFAELIGCSKKRISNLLSARQIPGAVRIPGLGWRVNYNLFMKLMDEHVVLPKWETR